MKRIISVILVFVLCIGATAVFADMDAENVTVIAEGQVLENGVDYTLTYQDNVAPGTATVVVNFMGNYAGELERTFEIKKAKHQSTGGGRGSHVVIVEPVTKYDSPYITGYEDNTFRPEADITRAEATTAVARAIGLEPQDNNNGKFPDISNHWAKGYINAVADKGIVNGYEDGNFRPNENITRAEFAKIIAKMLGGTSQNSNVEFTDTAEHWAQPYIAALAEKDMIAGYSDGTFRPDLPITRAEAVAVINRAVTRNHASDLVIQFKDVTPEHWAYAEIVKAAGTEKKDK